MAYVGIDVHKSECFVCVVDDKGAVLKEVHLRTARLSLTEKFSSLAGTPVLLEASTESEWVARHLESLGLKVIVADPSYAAMYAMRPRKLKTDRADAQALAQACRLGLYKEAHRMCDAQRRTRKHLTARALLVRQRTKLVNFTRAYLRSLGTPAPSCEVERFTLRARELTLADDDRLIVERLLCVIDDLQKQLEAFDQTIEHINATDERVQRLTTVPGVGVITAAAFVALLWDAKRFERAHQVEAYLGLVPSEHSSGDRERRGHITKRGDTYVRALLVQCAHTIMRRKTSQNAGLHEWAAEIQRRSTKGVAVVALARKLAGILFAMWRDEKAFDSTKQKRQEEKQAA